MVLKEVAQYFGLTTPRGEEDRSISSSLATRETMSAGSAAGSVQLPSSRLSQSSNIAGSNVRTRQTRNLPEFEVQQTSPTHGAVSTSAAGKLSSMMVPESRIPRSTVSAGQKSKTPGGPGRKGSEYDAFHDSKDLEDAYKDLMRRWRELEKSASERESQFCQALDDAKIREQSLRRALADAERRLATASNDLANLRSLTTEDVDTHVLLTSFDDLNDAVNEAAFRCINDLNLPDDVVRVSRLQNFQELADPGLRRLLASFLDGSAKAQLPLEQALVQAVQGIFYMVLHHFFFRPFSPRVEMTVNAMLRDVQSKIRATETQEYSARWRSITYNAFRGTGNDDAYVSNAAEMIATNARLVIDHFTESGHHDTSFEKLYEEARKVCAMTLRWKDSACGSHLSFDYEMFAPAPEDSFNQAEMRSDETPSISSKNHSRPIVALTIAAGLIASRTGDQRPPRVIRKAQVVLLDTGKEDRMQE